MRYPMVPLEEVLVPAQGARPVSPTADYEMAGMLNFGRGLFRKPNVAGHETSYKTLSRLRHGQFVYSRLFAWEGAVTVVTPPFDGAWVSPEFPAFDVVDDRCLPEYLAHIARWPAFHEALAGGGKGLGLRRQRVAPERLLAVAIPLPDVHEQRRVAAHLDRVVAAVASVALHRENSATRLAALAPSLAAQPGLTESDRRAAGWRRRPLGDVMTPVVDQITVEATGSYPNLGIYSFGRGLFEKPPIEGTNTSAKALNRVHGGQFIYSRLFAFEGAYAYVPQRFDGYFVSGEFPTFDVDPGSASAEFVAAALRSPGAWEDLRGSSRGLGLRRQRVQAESVLAHEMWFPPIEVQERLVAGIDRASEALERLGRSRALTDALLPSALNRAFAGVSSL